MSTKLLPAAVLAVAVGFASGSALAAPVLGSHVDSSVFSTAIGSTANWSYMGQNVAAFTGTGTATVAHRSSGYANSFGYANTSHGGRVQLLGPSAGVGSTAAVAGYSPGYLFYFEANGSDLLFFSDDNRQYTDGHDTGGNPGENQGDMDIFYNAVTAAWAFFFDDAGGGTFIAGDDNDYDDLVVTFQGAQNGVPEPASLGLLGAALAGFGLLQRRRTKAKA